MYLLTSANAAIAQNTRASLVVVGDEILFASGKITLTQRILLSKNKSSFDIEVRLARSAD